MSYPDEEVLSLPLQLVFPANCQCFKTSLSLMMRPNKTEHLSLTSLTSLVYYLRVRQGACLWEDWLKGSLILYEKVRLSLERFARDKCSGLFCPNNVCGTFLASQRKMKSFSKVQCRTYFFRLFVRVNTATFSPQCKGRRRKRFITLNLGMKASRKSGGPSTTWMAD